MQKYADYIKQIEIDSLWSGTKHILWNLDRRVNILSCQLDRRLERIDSGKLTGVYSKIVSSLLKSLRLRNIVDRLDIRLSFQLFAHLNDLRIGHILFKHHGHDKVLLHIGGEISSHKYGEYDQSE